MSKTYRVGIIGFAHMHVNNLVGHFSRHPQVELVACADTVPARPELCESRHTRAWNLRNAQENYGVAKTYADYGELLQKEACDLIICCAENARHAEVVEASAAAGAHVVVEKPMASSLAHGLRMVRACQAAGKELIVNWPMTWSPSARKAKALIDTGTIGRVLEVKYRGGHTGPLGAGVSHPGVEGGAAPISGVERGATWWHQTATGGGAMLDYCCYGAMVSRWYIGEQGQAAIALRANLNSHWGDAEDNAAMIVRFPQAMALYEGSWTTLAHGVSPGPIVYGTEGTLVADTQEGKPVVRLERGGDDSTVYDCAALPAGRSGIAEEVIHHLESGDPLHLTLQTPLNLDAMAILDAGVRAAESGKLETVDNPTWSIG